VTTITTKDGSKIVYEDWGSGRPVFFHDWPLSADVWDAQMLFPASQSLAETHGDRLNTDLLALLKA
jgi:non-heme chloroperoxidase